MERANSRKILPIIKALARAQGQSDSSDYPVRIGDTTQGPGIQIRVDWGGEPNSLGTFTVRNAEGQWEPCVDLDPALALNDLILPASQIGGETFTVEIQRGPDHVEIPFEAWALPIGWEAGKEPSSPEPGYSAVRDDDYTYDTTAAQVQAESAIQGGAQTLTLSLSTELDYELWVKLRHPTEPDLWCVQDPIVRTDDRGGGGAAS